MNKTKKICLLILTLLITLTLTGCKTIDNLSSITLECTREYYDTNNYKTIDKQTIKARNQYVTYIKSETLYEVEPDFLVNALEFGDSLANSLQNCNGVSLKYEKYDDKTLKITTKVDYELVNENELKNALGELYSETDPLLSGKKVELNKYKTVTLNEYTCK